jgi:hypothetical protein
MQILLRAGPFAGADLTSEPFFVQDGSGVVASNVDISANPGAFTTAPGRTIEFVFGLAAGHMLQAFVPFTSFTGGAPNIATHTVYIYCSTNGAGAFETGYYDPQVNVRTPVSNANPFTQGVQFGAYLWTNGGDKWMFGNSNGLGIVGNVYADAWQIQLPSSIPFNLLGTYIPAGVGTNQVPDTYTYAITFRRAASWMVIPQGGGLKYYYPDSDTLQESSPVFSTSVVLPATNTTPSVRTYSGIYNNSLVTGTTEGGETYYGCLYRSRTGSPTYVFVDYLENIPQATDIDGYPAFYTNQLDNTLANNADLIIHNDPPPIIGQVYPGAVITNAIAESIGEYQQQFAFNFVNPAFITKFKGRMLVFTMYPTSALGHAAPNYTIGLQPQLWYSGYGQPWSFNDDEGFLLVGPEDTPGNSDYSISSTARAPWTPNLLADTPMGVARVGAMAVAFKSLTTWGLFGDTASEFIMRYLFDIGCYASYSITTCEGGVFWLAPQGVYFFDGASPSYIGEPIRKALEALTPAQRRAAIGSYINRTFFLNVGGTMYCYYTPTQKWYTRPYAVSAMFPAPDLSNTLFASAVGTSATIWNINGSPALDLSEPIIATWATRVTDCNAPGIYKKFGFFQLVAPQQIGTVTVTLTIDPNFGSPQGFVWTWDLSQGNGAFVASLPDTCQGYEVQFTITTTAGAGATSPIIIREVMLHGEPTGALNSTSDEDLSGAMNRVPDS